MSATHTCVDRFSGFVQPYPLESRSADSVTDKLAQHFMTFGPPEFAECDSGSNLLKNVRVKGLCSFFWYSEQGQCGLLSPSGWVNRTAAFRY